MVYIRDVYLSPQQEEHIWVKHRVTREEVLEVCWGHTLFRSGRGRSVEAYGQTHSGRYVIVFLYAHGQGMYHVGTARDMVDAERRRFRRFRGV